MGNNKIGNGGARILGEAIKKNNVLIQLDISKNEITNEGAGYLFEGLSINTTLQELVFNNNNLKLKIEQNNENQDPTKEVKLETSDQNKESNSNDKDETINEQEEMIDTTKPNQLTESVQPKNGFEYFKNCSLISLWISGCFLGEEEAVNLAKGLSDNKSLTILNITNNHIILEGIFKVLVNLKDNTTLSNLNISNEQNDDVETKVEPEALYEAIMMTKISTISMINCNTSIFGNYMTNNNKTFDGRDVYY